MAWGGGGGAGAGGGGGGGWGFGVWWVLIDTYLNFEIVYL
jgi:hypothetical protein